MARSAALEIEVPFPGFYESCLSHEVDFEMDQIAENLSDCGSYADASDPDKEAFWPEPLRLDAGVLSSCLFDAMDYGAAHLDIAQRYADQFDAWAGAALGMFRFAWSYSWAKKHKVRTRVHGCGLRFADMSSPREYNFQTDRLFLTASKTFVRALWRMSKADGHCTLQRLMAKRFTSRSGFISHYSPHLAQWPADVCEWDHNQLGTLLRAVLALSDADENDLHSQVIEHGDISAAVNAAIDWQKFEQKRRAARFEALESWANADRQAVALFAAQKPDTFAALIADDPDSVLSWDLPRGDACGAFYRCAKTPDMFATC